MEVFQGWFKPYTVHHNYIHAVKPSLSPPPLPPNRVKQGAGDILSIKILSGITRLNWKVLLNKIRIFSIKKIILCKDFS